MTPPHLLGSFQNSIKSALVIATEKLQNISDSPTLDAELLLAHCLGKKRSYLHTWPEKDITQEQSDCFEALIEKRLNDYPVAYMLGTKPFWTLDLIVTPDVLIPRPETELLVETALEKIENIQNPKILDLGTGSGAIALALASERTDAIITATDNSSKALKIATENAMALQLDSQISFTQSNWYSKLLANKFDLIVSNPPYIAENDPHLKQTIRHEPVSALAADNHGMSDIEIIIKQGKRYLKPNGWMLIEHGYNQSHSTLELFTANKYINAKTLTDLSGLDRLSFGQYEIAIKIEFIK